MVPFARRVRTIRMCSLDARGEEQPGHSLQGLKVDRSIRRVDSWIDYGFAAYPGGGTGRKIEQVLDVQVDLPSTRMFRRPCYDAGELAADLPAGFGKTASIQQNFDGLRVWHDRGTLSQDAQKGQTSHPPNPGAPRRAVSQARPHASRNRRRTLWSARCDE